jgi:hypothetical protein
VFVKRVTDVSFKSYTTEPKNTFLTKVIKIILPGKHFLKGNEKSFKNVFQHHFIHITMMLAAL